MNTINFIAILVSALVAFGISSFWYSPFLFGNEWMNLNKISPKDMENIKKVGVIRSYIVQFILTIITFAVLGFLVSMSGAQSGTDGAFIGFLVWLGFVLPTSVSGLLWKKESFTLILIDTINYLVILTIGGAILGAW